jgi:hypothetical protein
MVQRDAEGLIRVASARIFWAHHPEKNRVRDVWVSTTDQADEDYTAEYFSPRWCSVVGNCDVDWLKVPEYTPEAVFGELVEMGFHAKAELVNALRQFGKIDACRPWAAAMLGRLGGPHQQDPDW